MKKVSLGLGWVRQISKNSHVGAIITQRVIKINPPNLLIRFFNIKLRVVIDIKVQCLIIQFFRKVSLSQRQFDILVLLEQLSISQQVQNVDKKLWGEKYSLNSIPCFYPNASIVCLIFDPFITEMKQCASI
jgi:hypothetical protein